MPGRGKRGKPNCGFPLFPPPLEIANSAISTFPQRRRRLPLSPNKTKKQNRLLALFERLQPSSYHPAKEASHRSMKRGIRGLVSGSSRVGIKIRFQAHFWIGKCWLSAAACTFEARDGAGKVAHASACRCGLQPTPASALVPTPEAPRRVSARQARVPAPRCRCDIFKLRRPQCHALCFCS